MCIIILCSHSFALLLPLLSLFLSFSHLVVLFLLSWLFYVSTFHVWENTCDICLFPTFYILCLSVLFNFDSLPLTSTPSFFMSYCLGFGILDKIWHFYFLSLVSLASIMVPNSIYFLASGTISFFILSKMTKVVKGIYVYVSLHT